MQFINNLRGLAILLIISGHSISTLPEKGQFMDIINNVVGNGTILFVVIAGYLFSETAAGYHYGKYLLNKISTVVVPYVLISMPIVLVYVFGLKHDNHWMDMAWFNGLNTPFKVGYLLVMGAHLSPLWFIPMIVVYYFISPAFALLRRWRLELPAFVVTLCIALYIGTPPHHVSLWSCVLFYLPCYTFGMLIQRYRAYIERPFFGSEWELLATLVVSVVTSILLIYDHMAIFGPITLLVQLALSLSLMRFFHARLNYRILWMDMLARLSFFIFFIHGYFVGVSRAAAAVLKAPRFVPKPVYELALSSVVFVIVTLASLGAYVVLKLILGKHSRRLIAA